MKRNLIYFIALSLILVPSMSLSQQIALPAPDKSASMTLMQALQQRHSERAFSSKEIDTQTLSTLLWAAAGINRPESNRITAPSAINAQDITIYVATPKGVWRYIPTDHALESVTDENVMAVAAGAQSFAATAPLNLILVSDRSRFRRPVDYDMYGAMDSGYVSENICLVCTALGLATVPRAWMEKETLREKLHLSESEQLMLNHPIGWAKE